MAGASDILIATGEPLVMDFIASTLSEHRISCATSAGEARVFLRSSVLDLIILDGVLPDGRYEDILALAEMLHVPTIVIAEHPRNPPPGHPYLTRPFTADMLMRGIRPMLGHRLASP